MKELKENLAALATYASADTRNAENFPAWSMSDEMRLEQLAMTGTLGSSFYATARDATQAAVELLERADAETLARAIVRGRQEGFIRAFPILGLLYLSKKDTVLFGKVFPEVVKTGNDLGDFIDLARSQRGFGRAVKRAIGAWLANSVTPYYAMKYRRSLADAVRISRFRGDDPLFAYVLRAYANVKGATAEKLEAAYAKYPELAANRRFIELLQAGEKTKAAELLRESNLDVDHLTAYYNQFDTAIWSAVAERSPVMRYLKYLSKFAREGVSLGELTAQKVTVENLKRARVFPFRLYTAYQAYCEEMEMRSWMKPVMPKPAQFEQKPFSSCFGETAETPQTEAPQMKPPRPIISVKQVLSKVLDDYALKFDWSEFRNYRWVIAPDMSGSMTSRIGKSSLSFAHVSAMFTAFFAKGVKADVLPWDTEVRTYSVSPEASVMTHIDAILSGVDGGTFMEAPVKAMMQRNIHADYSVFITDSEEYGSGWFFAWKEYRRLHPKAQAFIIRLDSYNTAPIPETEAEKFGVWQIFGWNDSVIDFIRYVIMTHKKG